MKRRLPTDNTQMVAIKNDFVRSRQDTAMTVAQAKVIRKLIASIDRDDTELKEYTCTMAELIRGAGLSHKAYENMDQLLAALKALETTHYIKDAQGLTQKKEIHWIVTCTTTLETGEITLRLNDDLKPYILQIKEQYTSYWLENVLKLRSFYSIRIYEYINSYLSLIQKTNKKGEPYVFTISQLRESINTGDKYERDSDFMRVIRTSLDEINKKTEMTVNYTTKKINGIWKVIIESITCEDTISEQLSGSGSQIESVAVVVESDYRKEYIAALSEYYQTTLSKSAGKRLSQKFGDCYDQYVRAGIVRQAIDYTRQILNGGGKISSIEAYTRKMIDVYIDHPPFLSEKNQKIFSYDRVSQAEIELFGSVSAAKQATERIMNADANRQYPVNLQDIELYVGSVKYFAEQECAFPTLDYPFYQRIIKCYKNEIDIRVIFDALWKTCVYRSRILEAGEAFNTYAYATTILEQNLKWLPIRYDENIEHMTIEWCWENIQIR